MKSLISISEETARASIDLVREFMERFGQPIATRINIDDRVLAWLRLKLIVEEAGELATALGFQVYFGHEGDEMRLFICRTAITRPDPVETLDALTDIQYVLDGAYLSLGFAHVKEAATAEVHRSNMTKLGADGKPVYRADGKVTKGPAFEEPDLRRVLQEGGR